MSLFGPPNIEKMKAECDISGLIGALMHEDGAVRWAAAEALGQSGDSRALVPLISTLQGTNQDVRSAAAQALGQLGDPRAVPALIALLADNTWELRQTAIKVLAKLGDIRAIEPLLTSLRDNHSYVRQAAVETLDALGYQPDNSGNAAAYWTAQGELDRCVEIGVPAVELLMIALQDDRESVRQAAAEALERLNWKPDDEHMVVYWMAKGQWDRCIEMGQPAIPPLADALSNPDHEVRRCAAGALGQIGASLGQPQCFDAAMTPLTELLTDERPDVRQAATWALGQIGGVAAVDALIQFAIVDESEMVRHDGQNALVRMGVPVIRPLLSALNGPALHKAVIEVLRQIGRPIVDWLVAAALDDKGNLCRIACEVLGELGDSRAAESLLIVAELDDRWEVRQAAIGALGKLGDQRSIEPLRAMLKNGDDPLRIAASGALAQLGDWRGIDLFIAQLKNGYEIMRKNAALALGQLGHSRAVGPLSLALKDSDGPVRQAAAEALVKIYHIRELDEQIKQRILAMRDGITSSHYDHTEYTTPCWGPGESIHTDQGIGVDFPL